MRDALVRAGRTFVQGFIGVVLGSGIINQIASGTFDFSAVKTVAVSAAIAGVGAVLSFVQNYLEDRYGAAYNKG